MAEYFTSNLSLNQHNILQYNKRPFKDIEEMNEKFVESINEVVKRDDSLYILGNWIFGSQDIGCFERSIIYFRNKIDCDNIFLVLANQDRRMKKNDVLLRNVNYLADYMEIVTKDRRSLILFHYAIPDWNRKNNGAWHLYGQNEKDLKGPCMSVSIDNYYKLFGEYRPFSMDQIVKLLSDKS